MSFEDATAQAAAVLRRLPTERKYAPSRLSRPPNAYVYVDHLGRLAIQLAGKGAGFLCVYTQHVVADPDPFKERKEKPKWVLVHGRLVNANAL